uniref:Uncharacterized protein LOC102804821 n=1 Tax=Saccoglossus kowalevskii TaxID=10224 RepID=A0ABM0MBS2_SACKO
MLDHRSERTTDRIMSEESWREITAMLNVMHSAKQLFVVIPVPLIFVDHNYLKRKKLEKLERKQKKGDRFDCPEELDEELTEQWASFYHDFERKRLIKLLLDFSLRKKVKVTVLSGDVHVGCWGRIETDSLVTMDIVTSSGIVSRPPKNLRVLYRMMKNNGFECFCLPDHGKVKMWLDDISCNGSREYEKYMVASQNFLILDPQVTVTGINSGKYEASFLKKPNKTFEKTRSRGLDLKEPHRFSRTIDNFTMFQGFSNVTISSGRSATSINGTPPSSIGRLSSSRHHASKHSSKLRKNQSHRSHTSKSHSHSESHQESHFSETKVFNKIRRH